MHGTKTVSCKSRATIFKVNTIPHLEQKQFNLLSTFDSEQGLESISAI